MFHEIESHNYYFIIILLIIIFSAILLGVSLAVIILRHYNAKLLQINYLKQRCLDLEQAHYLDVRASYEELRAFRHDFNSHILAMKNLAELEEWSRLESYIGQLYIDKTKSTLYNISTGNIIADAVLSQFQHSLSEDILFKINGQFNAECFVEDTDLCVILFNLLNNAHEALEHIGKKRQKEIFLSISALPSKIALTVENTSKSYTQEELTNLRTTKPDKQNHGFGLSSVRTVTKKYDGELLIKFDDGIFTAGILLRKPLTQTKIR